MMAGENLSIYYKIRCLDEKVEQLWPICVVFLNLINLLCSIDLFFAYLMKFLEVQAFKIPRWNLKYFKYTYHLN